ncbi:MAG: hypothetical protein A3G34_16805 [Candidatus Lindowbacteria bacterium RIFCSPLOWO2_12_FULL_62_27]|nr:MAG: hypothetical protein A3I06_02115 [Candidatus Lindowbacteria bacterium RIFCSPLOWO2_02_FULL_62_12]OGH62888.1 MAG: hypothetical protein A3G34_16805 [Candidatus Lindowbacteria bacterium RIFCSPLOWO2_12_FULL_62_27]
MTQRSLSKREADIVLAWEWEKQRLISIGDIMKRMRCSNGYARKMAHVLRKKGWLEMLTKGHYLLVGVARGPKGVPEMNPYLMARLLPKSHFFAYRFACAHHGLLTQIPRVIHIAVRRPKRPMDLKNVRFQFVELSAKRFFGYKEAMIMGEKINVSDVERSILDALDRPDLVGGIEAGAQALFHAGRKMDVTKVLDYLQRFDDSALARRFAYLCELLRIALPARLKSYLAGQVKKNPALLGSPRRWGTKGKLDARWNLILNVPKEDLLGEVRIG